MSASAAERAFAGRFEASRSERDAREPAWLGRLREEACSAFAEQGLPTTRLEDWRFTSLAALAKLELGAVADRADAAPVSGPEFLALGEAHRMVFVNGRIAPALLEQVENGTIRIIDLEFVMKDAAGAITTLSSQARQIQFALKLLF